MTFSKFRNKTNDLTAFKFSLISDSGRFRDISFYVDDDGFSGLMIGDGKIFTKATSELSLINHNDSGKIKILESKSDNVGEEILCRLIHTLKDIIHSSSFDDRERKIIKQHVFDVLNYDRNDRLIQASEDSLKRFIKHLKS